MLNLIQKFHQDSVKRDQEIIEHINELICRQSSDSQTLFIAQQKEILSHLYQKASSYTNLIILAGYAGIFGVWQNTKDLLDKRIIPWVALLVSCSLLLFVGFEVFKMIAESLFFKKLNVIIEKRFNEQQRIAAWKIAFNEYSNQQSKIWSIFLIPTVLSGFSAALILIYQFIRNLFIS